MTVNRLHRHWREAVHRCRGFLQNTLILKIVAFHGVSCLCSGATCDLSILHQQTCDDAEEGLDIWASPQQSVRAAVDNSMRAWESMAELTKLQIHTEWQAVGAINPLPLAVPLRFANVL